MSHVPTVAVVTVSFHSEGVLPAFLESVTGACSRPVLSIVVDNSGGTSPTIGELCARYGARLLVPGENLGYGGAINHAVATLPSEIEWILVSNPDVELAPASMDVLLDAVASRPTIGAAGPTVLNRDNSVYPSARALPSLGTGIGHALFANLWPRNPWTERYHRGVDSQGVTGWLSGSCFLVRRSVFDEVAGFDEGYFMYFEDVDLGYRISQAGYENIYVPAASVRHSGAHSTASRADAMRRAHHTSARRFLAKRYAGPRYALVRWTLNAGLSARAALTRSRRLG
ncbi:glycosyltransferase family 2 protein [Rathayibacter sp. YIM 133350]|uniref:glycosyltransferase family 2 protein n=1 Tax=Rathayibacter sp. YIM 133350 TaxID=3131992 RepID=UPI00307D971A